MYIVRLRAIRSHILVLVTSLRADHVLNIHVKQLWPQSGELESLWHHCSNLAHIWCMLETIATFRNHYNHSSYLCLSKTKSRSLHTPWSSSKWRYLTSQLRQRVQLFRSQIEIVSYKVTVLSTDSYRVDTKDTDEERALKLRWQVRESLEAPSGETAGALHV